ncbi:putative HHE domain-containing protein [Lyophyllum shimeji]|uniref:HHE domain-containing protein n=1 Tax=Lyophyllum shimeji TaxID=47721 RepID=A0A9P3UN87_LYOSH|nr:putative HHE domain-containing protein [Lyophyllum shimeji]
MSASHRVLSDAIEKDHKEMYDFYDEYVKAAGNPDAQERWATQLRWEVARHAVGEEIIVYPLMEEKLGNKGIQLADQDRADHQLIKERLYKLESLPAGSKEHADLLKETMDILHKHNDHEEREDLPLLEPTLGRESSSEAAAKFKRTKQFAPTRVHPAAPNKPPFETVAGLMAAPIDKLKDMFAKFPTEDMKEHLKTK